MSEVPEKGSELIDFVRDFASKNTLNVEEDLGFGFVRLRVTEAERRQAQQDIRCVEDVAVELVRNSRDAGAARVYVAARKEKTRWRHLTILDEGSGIPQPVRARIFESRVTSKVDEVLTDSHGIHGRGMALFSIRRSVESIELLRTSEGLGSIFKVLVDLERLAERKDQSTWPSISLEDGKTQVSGPRNILRSLVELAFDEPSPMIFYGSNAEILATLFAHSREEARGAHDPEKPAAGTLWNDLYGMREGKELAAFSGEILGLEVSERNAFRILEEDIRPLEPLNEQALRRSGISAPTPGAGREEERHGREEGRLARRFSRSDLDELNREVSDAAARIGDRYFLKVSRCRIQRTGDRLVISLFFDED